MKLNHASEKFYLATLGLATGTGEVRERLEHAAITLTVLRPEELPASIRVDFETLWQKLTTSKAEIPGEGNIHATLRQLDPDAARELAEKVFEMYFAVLGITPFGHKREDSSEG